MTWPQVGTVQVIPDTDRDRHVRSKQCPCGPTVERWTVEGRRHVRVVHHQFPEASKHCAHWEEGDGKCHRCGLANWCTERGEDDPASEAALAAGLAAPCTPPPRAEDVLPGPRATHGVQP